MTFREKLTSFPVHLLIMKMYVNIFFITYISFPNILYKQCCICVMRKPHLITVNFTWQISYSKCWITWQIYFYVRLFQTPSRKLFGGSNTLSEIIFGVTQFLNMRYCQYLRCPKPVNQIFQNILYKQPFPVLAWKLLNVFTPSFQNRTTEFRWSCYAYVRCL